jgi:hypothetical protein
VVSAVRVGYKNNEDSAENTVFTPEDFQRVDPTSGAYTFVNKKNHRLTLTPIKSKFDVNFEAIQRMPIVRDDDDTMTTPTTTDSDSSESS